MSERWVRSYFYVYLIHFEDSGYSFEIEELQREEIRAEFSEPINEIEILYQSFQSYFERFVARVVKTKSNL